MNWIKRKAYTPPFFAQILLCFLVVGLLLLGITMGATIHFSLTTMENQIENTLSSTASSLADSQMVYQSLVQGYCPEPLREYLSDLVKYTPDLDVITIADANSIRLYHVVPEEIGRTFVGGDQGPALAGEEYFSDAVGTLGMQHRYFSPVTDNSGKVLGFVLASATTGRVDSLRAEIFRTYSQIGMFMVILLLVVCAGLSFVLQRTLLGFHPEDLVNAYLTQQAVFQNLDEGVIFVDPKGTILLINDAASDILASKGVVNTPLDKLLQTEGGDCLWEHPGEDLPTSRPNVLASNELLEKDGHRLGTILILKDKTEARRRAEQLSGSRHIISALRANSHEFMNKLHVISGLLQMNRLEDALQYIGDISQLQTQAIGPILQCVQNPNVAALLLGKLTNTRELDIHLTLLPNSALPEHSAYLTTNDLVAVVGNLLENAIEAVNAQMASKPRNVDLQITEDEKGLLIMVSDTGVGIEPWHLNKIFDQGFSTKGEGRGVGMSLIQDIVSRREGNIEVDSDPGNGSTFTLIFSKKRERM